MIPKLSLRLLLCLSLISSSLFSVQELRAQEPEQEDEWSPGLYMRQATDNAFEKASLMSALSEFSFSNNLFMAGALLSVGSTIALDLELEAGASYTFIGGGDEDIVDLDMYIVDRNGEVVASDVEDDDTPIPDFTADYSGRYSLRIQLVSGQAPTSFIGFTMLTTSGTTIEEPDFLATSDNFFESGTTLHNASSGVKWHDLDNQWCFFGLLLDEGEYWELENLHLGSEEHFLYAIGSGNSSDLNLTLLNLDGAVIASDNEDDPYPILEVNTRESERYTLRIDNINSAGRAIILLGVVSE